MFYENLKQAPTLAEYMSRISQNEVGLRHFKVKVSDFKLDNDSTASLVSKDIDGVFPVSSGAFADLANLAKIPQDYFLKCDDELRAISFNHRIKQLVPPEAQWAITIKDDKIYKISNSNLLTIPRVKILDTISNSKPHDVNRQDLQVIEYQYNGSFDVSIISPNTQSEPIKGDIVAFGVNVRGSRNGAIQAQGAAFRLVCSNGAINRICTHHHLKRPQTDGLSEADFLENIAAVSRQAWNEWDAHADSLEKLTKITLDISNIEDLTKKLTAKPFFIPLKNVKLIIDYLKEHHSRQVVTLYELYNAMTFIGTHQTSLPYDFRVRLRLGAGEISRRNSRICDLCHQLVLDGRGNIAKIG